jgi:hypothetical protein
MACDTSASTFVGQRNSGEAWVVSKDLRHPSTDNDRGGPTSSETETVLIIVVVSIEMRHRRRGHDHALDRMRRDNDTVTVPPDPGEARPAVNRLGLSSLKRSGVQVASFSP